MFFWFLCHLFTCVNWPIPLLKKYKLRLKCALCLRCPLIPRSFRLFLAFVGGGGLDWWPSAHFHSVVAIIWCFCLQGGPWSADLATLQAAGCLLSQLAHPPLRLCRFGCPVESCIRCPDGGHRARWAGYQDAGSSPQREILARVKPYA